MQGAQMLKVRLKLPLVDPDFTKGVALGELSRPSRNSDGRLVYGLASPMARLPNRGKPRICGGFGAVPVPLALSVSEHDLGVREQP
jgi:hypothetical protein